MKSINRSVCRALALHLNRPPSSIHAFHRLEEDLDVTPLEIVLVALDIEELEEIEIPMEDLEGMKTVGDLVTFFSATVRRGRGVAESAAE